jgi:hypothetical protein
MGSNKKRQRKIDTKPLESKLDQVASEARAVGSAGVSVLSNDNLFSIDKSGDEQVRKRVKFLKIDEVPILSHSYVSRFSNHQVIFQEFSVEHTRLLPQSMISSVKTEKRHGYP